jgi:hypothetical protein
MSETTAMNGASGTVECPCCDKRVRAYVRDGSWIIGRHDDADGDQCIAAQTHITERSVSR